MSPITGILVLLVLVAVVGFIGYKRNAKFKNKVDEFKDKI